MRKTIIFGASALALSLAGAASAQTAGTPNIASPDCIGVGGNCSDISQQGNGNEATVAQGPGVENVSDIDQDGSGLVANVDQQHSNPGGAIGYSTAATESVIDQTGSSAFASVTQSGTLRPTDDNDSTIRQNSATGGEFNVADRMDDLNARPPLADVGSFSNAAVVRQTAGEKNTSLIEQGTETASVSGNLAYVEQIGSGHDATIFQTGNDNAAIIDESGEVGESFSNNDALIDQSGNGNLADIDQEGSDLSSTVIQIGNDNEAFVMDQEGSNNSVLIRQEGNENLAMVDDQLGSDNLSETTQLSNNNEAYITQGGSENDSFITQMTGDGNVADVTQTGMNGFSDIMQSGSGNNAIVNQSGGSTGVE